LIILPHFLPYFCSVPETDWWARGDGLDSSHGDQGYHVGTEPGSPPPPPHTQRGLGMGGRRWL
jgi:hypothetical protein